VHRLHYVARTDRGLIRSTNQDSLFAGDRLLVVAHGMGGHAAGDTASRLVVDAFMPLNADKPGPDLLRSLLEATRTGNASIADMVAEHPDLEGMGTTVTAMLFDGGRAALAHVGDSRAYLYRDGVLHQLTHDDTFVQSLVDDGRITEHQAHEHPQRNLLLRALTGQELDPMLVEREIRVGDRYMLCSDGLSGVIDPESIADALAHPDPEVAADTLIQLALVSGGPDNVTTIVADVLATGGRLDADAVPVGAPAAAHDDPASTNPIARLTREMPRVPLPPIPEEPAAPADVLDEDEDEDEDDESDSDRDIADAATDVAASGGSTATASGLAAGQVRTGTGGAPAESSADGESRSDEGDLDRAPRRRDASDVARRHWYRRGAVIVAALVLLGVVITGSTMWVRHQYYVSEQGNVVVVFRGVNGSLLGWRFSTFEETSCAGDTDCTPMKVSDLQPAAQNQVRAGIKVTSLAGARTVVQRLSAQLLPPCPPPGESDDEDDAAPATSTPTTSAPPATSPPSTAPATTPATSAPRTTTAPAAATVTAPTSPAASTEPPTAPDMLAADAPSAETGQPLEAAGGPEVAVVAVGGTASVERAGIADVPTFSETPPAAADLAGQAFGPAVPDPTGHEGGVIPGLVAASTDVATSPSDTVTATPLAPATPIPGVTCRTVQ
jgi:protein phosphatase